VTLRPRVFAPVTFPAGLDSDQGAPDTVAAGPAGDPGAPERVDITVDGLDHSGLSYEVRVFLDNPAADAWTPATDGEGYAGSIHVYGQGRPQAHGDDGGEARLVIPRSIIVSEAVASRAADGRELSVTLVPIAVGGVAAEVDLSAGDVAVRIDRGLG
jgi:hypothetical protein